MMHTTRQCLVGILAAAMVLFATGSIRADWVPADGHKMHYPQLPDPQGWDVDITTDFVYDDWQCSASGEVNDIHFWMSWLGDNVGLITRIDVEIWDDVPAGVDLPYSHPGAELWSASFLPGQFLITPAISGVGQGWFEPNTGQSNKPDHDWYYQVNIPQIDNPFIQQQDTIYWLGLHIIPATEEPQPMAGWKTSLDHFNDDAAYYFSGWQELIDPLPPNESLDMAFVITPEPGSLLLIGAGMLAALGYRKR